MFDWWVSVVEKRWRLLEWGQARECHLSCVWNFWIIWSAPHVRGKFLVFYLVNYLYLLTNSVLIVWFDMIFPSTYLESFVLRSQMLKHLHESKTSLSRNHKRTRKLQLFFSGLLLVDSVCAIDLMTFELVLGPNVKLVVDEPFVSKQGKTFWDYIREEVDSLYGLKVFKRACDFFWASSLGE